jgi:U3 small nucleolar RNA-associated protein 20
MCFNSIHIALLPLKEIMLETNDNIVNRQMVEVFRRLSSGLNNNSNIEIKQFMIFIYQLTSETLPLTQHTSGKNKHVSDLERNFTVQLKRPESTNSLKYYEANAHLFIEFGLSLLLMMIKRDKIDLKNQIHLELLDPFTDLLGKCLYSKHIQVDEISKCRCRF